MSILILVHLNQMAIRRGGLRDVLAHLPLVTIRPSQAAALSVIRGSEEDGNAGRGPSSGAYPLTTDCPPCGAVAPRTMCHGLGGQGARQPSLRSGRLRRPARAEWDSYKEKLLHMSSLCSSFFARIRRLMPSTVYLLRYSFQFSGKAK